MKQEKRVIESVGELVEVLSQGVKLIEFTKCRWDEMKFNQYFSMDGLNIRIKNGNYRYAEPVEVVELYFNDNEESVNIEVEGVFKMYEAKENTDTHKQTQIIQDGKVIYTKTAKI